VDRLCEKNHYNVKIQKSDKGIHNVFGYKIDINVVITNISVTKFF